jgi:hypothetical protein
VKQLAFIFLACVLSWQAVLAQDERFFRQLFSQELGERAKLVKKHKWRVQTPYYEFDLDRDGVKEGIVYEKKDGEDYINFHAPNKKLLKSYFLPAQGPGAKVFRILIKDLSPTTRILILYFYEGYVEYLQSYGSVRLYFVTIDNNNLSTLSFFKGPIYFYELEEFSKTYFQHNYKLSVIDQDGDGVREVLVKYQDIHYFFKYKGKGKWARL